MNTTTPLAHIQRPKCESRDRARNVVYLLALLLSLAFLGCDPDLDEPAGELIVRNQSEEYLTISFVKPNGSPLATDGIADSVGPGQGRELILPVEALTSPGSDCADVDVEASVDGRLVDRLNGPVCRGQTWIIKDS